MNNQQAEAMKQYMGTSTRKMTVVLAGIAALCALLYFTMEGDARLGVLIFCGIVFIMILAACLWMNLKLKFLFVRFEKAGELETLMQDFEKSVPVAGDTIRMGEKYCFGRGCSDAVAYRDITKVVHYCRITNGAVSDRSLRYDTKDKENQVLCGLPRLRGYETAVSEICGALLAHNPGIRIG